VSDVIPAEERPHRVSALLGVDPAEEPGGIDPANRAQGTGRPDDDEHAARVAASEAATAEAADAARAGTTAAVSQAGEYSYTSDDVPTNADQVVDFLRAAEDDDDREAREAIVSEVESARDGGERKTVTDELAR
jgi:hypothetical protein